MSSETTGTMQSEKIGELAQALARAQSVMESAKKDCVNPFFRSKYADLASVWDACRGPLAANGLAVIQTLGGNQSEIEVITTLAHVSGEWIRSSFRLTPSKTDPQGAGSAITYARRYALSAIVGISPEDDDGNSASGKQPTSVAKVSVPLVHSAPTPAAKKPVVPEVLPPVAPSAPVEPPKKKPGSPSNASKEAEKAAEAPAPAPSQPPVAEPEPDIYAELAAFIEPFKADALQWFWAKEWLAGDTEDIRRISEEKASAVLARKQYFAQAVKTYIAKLKEDA